MQRLEVSGAARPIYGSLGFRRLNLVSKNLDLREICPVPEKDQRQVPDNKKRTVGFHTKGGIHCSTEGR